MSTRQHVSQEVRRLTIAAAVIVLAVGCGSASKPSSGGPPGSTPASGSASGSGSASSPGSPSATTGVPTASSPSTPPTGSSATTSANPPLGSPVNLPLWPFASLDQAWAWEQSYTSGGHEPWHLDAGQTALAFTQGYLGFTGIDKVVSTVVASGRDAHIGVGFATPSTPPGTVTSAVVHLVRYGPDADAPWEVVGTADTTLTLTAPAYGSVAHSPMTVGGAITGVDESIKVQIRTASRHMPLAELPGMPAGGSATPWHVSIAFPGTTDPVLTVVASTGGHLAAVERFAVTGVRSG